MRVQMPIFGEGAAIEQSPPAKLQESSLSSTTESGNGLKPTLLCVDDNKIALHCQKLVLESAGYSVLVASDSATAMQLFSSSAIDMVLSDYYLQNCTGGELAAEMKMLKPDVPIAIISGVPEPPEGMEHADLFICKIDSPPEVLQQIAKLLNGRR